MANKFCSRCGKELAEGKRFCGGCGQAVSSAARSMRQSSQAVTATASTPAGSASAASCCVHCGTVLTAGKAFCRQCGHAVGALPLQPQAVPDTTVPSHGDVTQEELGSFREERKEPRTTTPASIPEAVPATAQDVSVPATSRPAPQVPSTRKIGVAIGIGAAVLMASGGVWAWNIYCHRSISSTPSAAPQYQQPATSSQKPAPGNPRNETAGTQQPNSSVDAKPMPSIAPVATHQMANSSRHDILQSARTVKAEPPAAVAEPIAAPAAVAAPKADPQRSGTLHYQGPPVPLNGQVVFDHLPAARIRFVFDRQSWALTIKTNPDGTKRVTLISLKQGYQASCDLKWEIAQ